MTAVSVQTPAPVSASRRPSPAFRLLWLYLRSRRVPSAVAGLALFTVRGPRTRLSGDG